MTVTRDGKPVPSCCHSIAHRSRPRLAPALVPPAGYGSTSLRRDIDSVIDQRYEHPRPRRAASRHSTVCCSNELTTCVASPDHSSPPSPRRAVGRTPRGHVSHVSKRHDSSGSNRRRPTSTPSLRRRRARAFGGGCIVAPPAERRGLGPMTRCRASRCPTTFHSSHATRTLCTSMDSTCGRYRSGLAPKNLRADAQPNDSR